MELLLIELLLGFAIGLSLGMLGGGGSILTVPALVYIIGQRPHAAVAASLVIVGLNAITGASFHQRHGTLRWRIALIFGGIGMLTSYLAASVSRQLPETMLMGLFAILMLVVGGLMIARKTPQPRADGSHAPWLVVAAGGAAVGTLTGFLGVGGGFLIVPALVMLVGLSMREAVATSLAVIAMNSFAGLLGHLGGSTLDLGLILVFGAAGVAGTFTGAQLARRIQPARLQQSFAVFVIALSVFLLYDNIGKLLA